MTKVILFIISGGSYKIETLRAAKNLGYDIVVAEKGYKNEYGLADHVLDTDTNNIDQLLLKVIELNTRIQIAGVVTFAEFGIEPAAVIASALKLPGLNIGAAKMCRNKYLTRMAQQANNIPHPDFRLLSNLGDFTKICDEMQLPLLIKPVNFGGACGVEKISADTNLTELIDFLKNDRKTSPINTLMNDHLSNYWLVEEFLDGFEISVESITNNGETTVLAIHDIYRYYKGP